MILAPALGQGVGRKPEAAVQQAVRDRFGVSEFTLQELNAVTTGRALEVDLVLGGVARRMVLQPQSIRAPGFRVLAQAGDGSWQELEVPESQTFRGYATGCGGSSVSATVGEHGIRALVRLNDAEGLTWVIEPLRSVLAEAAAEQHLVYRASESAGADGVCGHRESGAALAGAPQPSGGGTMALDVKVCRIACDADFEYYALHGSSVAATAADIEMILNGVSAIYELDTGVSFQITQILVRSAEPDPYTSANVDGLLAEFRAQWRSGHPDIPRDLAQLFTGKSFGSILGNGYVSQVCPGWDHYSLVRSRWQADLGKRIALSAHEIGHNLDAIHCDYDADPRCRIMCPSLGGCSNGYHSFEALNISRIRDRLAKAGCLTTGTVTTPSTSLPFSDNFDTISYPPQLPDPARWTAADLAECQYKHLEIKIGRDYSSNQKLGTVRTLPMTLSGPATVSYRVNPNYIPTTQSLKIEHFDSTAFTWRELRTLRSSGSGGYTAYQDTVPTNGYGCCFAVRFSAYGTALTASGTWMIDDVRIDETPTAPQLSIACTTTNTIAISWPQTASAWTLETTQTLGSASGAWEALPSPYPTNTTEYVVTESLSAGTRFYRLRSP